MFSVIVLPSWLTVPVVMEPVKPNGFPIAITGSPTFSEEEFTNRSGLNWSAGALLTSSTAKSEYTSWPSTFAEYAFPSLKVTLMSVAPFTTW